MAGSTGFRLRRPKPHRSWAGGEVGRSTGGYGATVDETGSGKPAMSEAPRARHSDLDLALELHTGQRGANCRVSRPDTRKHLDYAHYPSQDSSCFHRGVHTRTSTRPWSRCQRPIVFKLCGARRLSILL